MTESPLLDPSDDTPAPTGKGHDSPFVHDTTAETFEQDVMVRSQDVPIVIDFWAPWCDPCRQLAPLLEKLVGEAGGRWHLVKVNIDECEDLAMAFQVQSIPLLVAFVGGQPVDSAPGVLTEEQLREWLSRFVPSEASILIADGEELEADDPGRAAAKYREALSLEPDNDAVKLRLARVAVALEDSAGAASLIAELEQRGFLEPEAQSLKDQLEITSSASQSGGVSEARKAADKAPEDGELQLKLAEALAAERQFDEAFTICLGIVERDRDGLGQNARDALVTFFGMPTADPEVVSQARRRLATLLY
ncbi:MAG TPA: co-chaperone YbbN [Planctomycetaceae bacterium]|nr:co-chaperone YbbN [Planctomycetaceae bacterium]|tara:strand:- start:4242 stop:5159 length:918 start_codon:yes stop_codon:yes gene_type:complete